MMIQSKLTFAVPLTAFMRKQAKTWSEIRKSAEKQKQDYLKALGILSVNFYCQCMSIETDLDSSDYFNPITRNLMDVADLQLKDIGKVECRTVLLLPDDNYCYIPTEVWCDRIGYIVVMIDEEENQAQILGFVDKVETEELPLTELKSLEDFLLKVEEVQIAQIFAKTTVEPISETALIANSIKKPPVINLAQWVSLVSKPLQKIQPHQTMKEIASSLSQEIIDFGDDIWNLILFETRAVYARTATAKSTAVSKSDNEITSLFAFERNLTIAGQNYKLQTTLRHDQDSNEIIWRFKLTNSQPDGFIPGGFKLRLLLENGKAFEGNQDFAEKTEKELYVDVVLDKGDRIIWETEPMPENYIREVLTFNDEHLQEI